VLCVVCCVLCVVCCVFSSSVGSSVGSVYYIYIIAKLLQYTVKVLTELHIIKKRKQIVLLYRGK
jgi:hypothetical protein